MPALKNPKHEAFAQKVALGASAAEAYRQGWDCAPESAEKAGPRLAKTVEVMLRIEELRKKVAVAVDKKFDLTKEAWLEELREIATEARQAEDFSAATGALTQIGKAAAYYEPEKHQLEVSIVIGGNAESND